MTDAELRTVVRDVIARVRHDTAPDPRPVDALRIARQHSSHAMFVLPVGSDGDGPCLIEPAVTCNHCGYCKSYGH